MTRGAVINVSSVAAFGQSEGNVSYCATKAWMNSFTEGLAIELRGAGSPVRVQALCPGFTVTEFHDTLGIDRRTIPSYLWMSSEEIVDASLRGLKRNKVVVIPGWKYKVGVAEEPSLCDSQPFAAAGQGSTRLIVECVPNFSEGRDPLIVDGITRAIAQTPRVKLLDRTSDPDHHRSVFTFAGRSTRWVGKAAFEAVRAAVATIDISRHAGVHPRVGAADVVPFVPVDRDELSLRARLFV
jgi:hypothetical protein